MIYDRTLDDVLRAQEIVSNKVQKKVSLTEEDVETLERGCITINTLNRIENKQDELKRTFNEMGYWNTPVENKSWTTVDVFWQADLDRIVRNLDWLKKAFFVYSSSPAVPLPKYYYSNINDMEKILLDLEQMISEVKKWYMECGTFNCGEVLS